MGKKDPYKAAMAWVKKDNARKAREQAAQYKREQRETERNLGRTARNGTGRQLVVCTECDGHGWKPNPDIIVRDPESPDSIKCLPCKGDGFIYI